MTCVTALAKWHYSRSKTGLLLVDTPTVLYRFAKRDMQAKTQTSPSLKASLTGARCGTTLMYDWFDKAWWTVEDNSQIPFSSRRKCLKWTRPAQQYGWESSFHCRRRGQRVCGPAAFHEHAVCSARGSRQRLFRRSIPGGHSVTSYSTAGSLWQCHAAILESSQYRVSCRTREEQATWAVWRFTTRR